MSARVEAERRPRHVGFVATRDERLDEHVDKVGVGMQNHCAAIADGQGDACKVVQPATRELLLASNCCLVQSSCVCTFSALRSNSQQSS